MDPRLQCESLHPHLLTVQRLLKNRQSALKAYQVAQATTKAKQDKVDAGQGGETMAAELQKVFSLLRTFVNYL